MPAFVIKPLHLIHRCLITEDAVTMHVTQCRQLTLTVTSDDTRAVTCATLIELLVLYLVLEFCMS